MNWPLVLALAATGLVMGTASVLGWTAGIEGWPWVVIALVGIRAIAWKAPGRRSPHSILAIS